MSRNSNALAMLACSALLMLAAFGCSNPGDVLGPEVVNQSLYVDNPTFVRILSTSTKGVPSVALTSGVSQFVSAADGGTVTNGTVTLIFPAGALPQDTEITMDMLSDGTLGVEVGPHGMQFLLPVRMVMDLHGTTADGMGDLVQTVYYNETLNRYERQQMLSDGDPNSSTAMIRHFSKYKGNIDG